MSDIIANVTSEGSLAKIRIRPFAFDIAKGPSFSVEFLTAEDRIIDVRHGVYPVATTWQNWGAGTVEDDIQYVRTMVAERFALSLADVQPELTIEPELPIGPGDVIQQFA